MASDTRTRMLEATARLLRQRGYHGTSLNDILAASGAPRGSLYFHFPGGKDQLVIEVTRASVADVAARLRETLTAEKSPGVAIRKIFAATARMLDERFRARLSGGAGRAGRHQRSARAHGAQPSGIRTVDRAFAGIVR